MWCCQFEVHYREEVVHFLRSGAASSCLAAQAKVSFQETQILRVYLIF